MAFDYIQHPKKRAMLAALAKTGNVTAAAKIARVDRTTHYVWEREDPDYQAAAAEAMEEATDLLEKEARRRAETGTLKPVFWKGEKVGTVREYSDTLLIFLLKGQRPDKYRERSEVKHTGGVNVSGLDLSKLSQAELDTIENLLAKAADEAPQP